MFHADYYETGAVIDRIAAKQHLRNLPQCVECGRQGCTTLRKSECDYCGDFGTDAVVIEGEVFCGYCR